MGIAYHTLYTPDGAGVNLSGQVDIGTVTATYPATTTTGASTAVTLTWNEPIPTPYVALATPVEASAIYFTSPTTKSVVMNVIPLLGTATLNGGTTEVLLLS